MRDQLEQLVELGLHHQVTDFHFILYHGSLRVMMRGRNGMEEVQSALLDLRLFHYLKYIANLDLGNCDKPQSGSFPLDIHGQTLFFRFSLITSFDKETGVLRVLNNHQNITLDDLSSEKKQTDVFRRWTRQRSGLIILSGPTGSGKTTTLHALLDEIAKIGKAKIMTLEDPIEIHDSRFVQLAINECGGFTYEEGIRQLMRHDPDVIMIGEIRDSYTAKMAYRCALTGHMVFSSIHARTASEALKRLQELGVDKQEWQHTLTAICAQRLFMRKNHEKERICIYEILEGTKLQSVLENKEIFNHEDIEVKIRKAVEKQLISKTAAEGDLYAEAF